MQEFRFSGKMAAHFLRGCFSLEPCRRLSFCTECLAAGLEVAPMGPLLFLHSVPPISSQIHFSPVKRRETHRGLPGAGNLCSGACGQARALPPLCQDLQSYRDLRAVGAEVEADEDAGPGDAAGR